MVGTAVEGIARYYDQLNARLDETVLSTESLREVVELLLNPGEQPTDADAIADWIDGQRGARARVQWFLETLARRVGVELPSDDHAADALRDQFVNEARQGLDAALQWLGATFRADAYVPSDHGNYTRWHQVFFDGQTPAEKLSADFHSARCSMAFLSESTRLLVEAADIKLSLADLEFLMREHAEDRPKDLARWFRKLAAPRLASYRAGIAFAAPVDLVLRRACAAWCVEHLPPSRDDVCLRDQYGHEQIKYDSDKRRLLESVGVECAPLPRASANTERQAPNG